MAKIKIGNISADMRLVNDWYGIPWFQQLTTFMDNYTPIGREVTIATSTTLRMRLWDAQNRVVTMTVTGDIASGTIHRMKINAMGTELNLGGTIHVDLHTGAMTGWITSESAYKAATHALLVEFSQIHEYLNDLLSDPDDATSLAGRDTIISGNGNDYLLGYGGADLLTSGGGTDTLDGGAGNDTMKGGTGNDTYLVDSTGDVAIENLAAGADTVLSSASYHLGQNLENLTLTGAANISGTGNSDTNAIQGNSGDNLIAGGAGSDKMKGGEGNDEYVVDNPGDVVIEYLGQGSDRVRSSVTFTLPANVEHLALTGSKVINGFGNALANSLTGNNAANRLEGKAGDDILKGEGGSDTLAGALGLDTLSGGPGADTFLFDTAPAVNNLDTITDFVRGVDTIALDHAVYTALGAPGDFAVGDARFYAAAGAKAGHDADDRVVYDSASGALYYDTDGSGPTAAIKIAILGTVTHPVLAASDLLVV